jgi:hypothetical protein
MIGDFGLAHYVFAQARPLSQIHDSGLFEFV